MKVNGLICQYADLLERNNIYFVISTYLSLDTTHLCSNINTDENEKIQNAIKEVSKRDCIIMEDFNHGRIQWKSLEYWE